MTLAELLADIRLKTGLAVVADTSPADTGLYYLCEGGEEGPSVASFWIDDYEDEPGHPPALLLDTFSAREGYGYLRDCLAGITAQA